MAHGLAIPTIFTPNIIPRGLDSTACAIIIFMAASRNCLFVKPLRGQGPVESPPHFLVQNRPKHITISHTQCSGQSALSEVLLVSGPGAIFWLEANPGSCFKVFSRARLHGA